MVCGEFEGELVGIGIGCFVEGLMGIIRCYGLNKELNVFLVVWICLFVGWVRMCLYCLGVKFFIFG